MGLSLLRTTSSFMALDTIHGPETSEFASLAWISSPKVKLEYRRGSWTLSLKLFLDILVLPKLQYFSKFSPLPCQLRFILSFHLTQTKHRCCSQTLPLSLPLSNPSGIFLALSQNPSTSDDPPLSLPVSVAILVRPGVHQLPPGPELKPFSSGLFSTEKAGWPFRNVEAIMLRSWQGDLSLWASSYMTSHVSYPTQEAQPWWSPQLLWHKEPVCIMAPLPLQFCLGYRVNNLRASESSVKYLCLEFHFDLSVKTATLSMQGPFRFPYSILSAKHSMYTWSSNPLDRPPAHSACPLIRHTYLEPYLL